MCVGIIHHEGLRRAKRQRKGEFVLLNWDIHLLLLSDIGAPGSQDFGFRLNYTTDMFGSPACSQSSRLTQVIMEAEKSHEKSIYIPGLSRGTELIGYIDQ